MLPLKAILRFAAGPLATLALLGCATAGVDAVSAATSAAASALAAPSIGAGRGKGGALIVLAARAGGSTGRIGEAIADRLGAEIASPELVDPGELGNYALVGFGSGIFDQAHHASLLRLAESLPDSPGLRVFIFSTSGVSRRFALDHGIDDPHAALRDRLGAKGCAVVGEFNCVGFNDNSFLKLFGGMNRGRPNRADLALARAFAEKLEVSR